MTNPFIDNPAIRYALARELNYIRKVAHHITHNKYGSKYGSATFLDYSTKAARETASIIQIELLANERRPRK